MKKKQKWDYQKIFFVILALSWFSGVLFFVLNNWFEVEGEFGIEKHPWQFPLIKIHSAAAFLIMVSYGYFLGAHVKVTWKIRPMPISGIVMMALPVMMIVSGYSLYYIASDVSRVYLGYFHFAIGVILPLVLIIHIKQVVNEKNRKKERRIRKKMAQERQV